MFTRILNLLVAPAENRQPWPDWRLLLAILLSGLIASILLYRAPFLAHDWRFFFVNEQSGNQYVPWLADVLLVPFLYWMPLDTGIALLHGFTLSTVLIMAFWQGIQCFPEDRKTRWLAVLFIILGPHIYALLWLGQVEVLPLLGLALLPFGVPLLFTKPHMAVWPMLGSRRNTVWLIGFILLSLVLFPLWPLDLLSSAVNTRIASRHPLAMGWSDTTPLIIPLAALMLLFTNRDHYRLMAAGVLLSPFIMPYHFYLLLPALGRVRGYRQIGLWLATLMIIPAYTVGGFGKVLGYLHPVLLWVLLAPEISVKAVFNDPETLFRRMLRFGHQLLEAIRGESTPQLQNSSTEGTK